MSNFAKATMAAFTLTVLLLVLWWVYGSQLSRDKTQTSLTALDQLESMGIPQFSLKKLDGTEYSISSTKGKFLVLNFWATWCAPCVEEFPSMVKLAQKYSNELIFVTVSADERKRDVDDFIKAFQGYGDNIVHLWDPSLEVAKQFGTVKLPETYIIGPDHKLLKKVANTQDWTNDNVFRYFDKIIVDGR